MKTFWLALIAVFAAFTIGLSDADAKRVGGGKSVGKQAPSSTINRDATPSSPAGNAATPASPSAPSAAAAGRPAAPAAAGGNRWLGPIAGLAAGLGLAALASHLGFGEGLANFMMIAMLAVAALVVVRMIMSRRAAAAQPKPAYAGGYQYSGLGQEASVPNYQPSSAPASSRDQPIDAVRPAAQPVTGYDAPAGFDAEGFVRRAKVNFVRLQAAFDAGDTADLREFTSPEMFAELKLEIDERNGAPNQTDVVTLEAALLGVQSGVTEHLASVRFSGMLREQPNAAAEAFDEVWNFSRPSQGEGGWVLAGIQQLAKA
jgi:predicted lipid-binding transport protein (Tim44 family)